MRGTRYAYGPYIKINVGNFGPAGITPDTKLRAYITNKSCKLQIVTLGKEEFVSQGPPCEVLECLPCSFL